MKTYSHEDLQIGIAPDFVGRHSMAAVTACKEYLT